MSTNYKVQNKLNWNDHTWKDDINTILSDEFSQFERSRAFLKMKRRVLGVYRRTARYTKLLESEGETVRSFLDNVLFRSILKFDLTRHTFFAYFAEAAKNAIGLLLRRKKHIKDSGVTFEELHENIEFVEEVSYNLVAEVFGKKHLSSRQRRLLGLRLQGYKCREIQKKLMLNRYEYDQTVARIQETAREVLEVKYVADEE
jgi:hypothetical protein